MKRRTLKEAVIALFEKIATESLDGYEPKEPIPVYIAGGTAVYLYTGARVSEDLDAIMNARVMIPENLKIGWYDPQGKRHNLIFDKTYNDTLGPLNENYPDRAKSFGQVDKKLTISLLAPIDIIISKLGRFQDHDRTDIIELVARFDIAEKEFRTLSDEVLVTYMGNTKPLQHNIEEVCELLRLKEERPFDWKEEAKARQIVFP